MACVPESEPECQGGAGGAGGAPPGCCLSIEDCFTLDSETPAGNQACGEVAQGHSFVVVPDTTTSQRFNATGTVPGRLLTWGNVFGPKGEVGAQLQRLNLNGPLQYDFSAQWPNMDSGRTTGDVLVLPPPGSRATVGFLLGTCSGQTKGLACPGEMAVAYASRFATNVMGADLSFVTSQTGTSKSASRLIAGAAVSPDFKANDDLVALALEQGPWDGEGPTTGYPRLAALRFDAFVEPVSEVALPTDCSLDSALSDPTKKVMARGAAFLSEGGAYFAGSLCSSEGFVFKVLPNGTQTEVKFTSTETSVAGVRVAADWLVVVGTFAGPLTMVSANGDVTQLAEENPAGQTAFIAIFDKDLNLNRFASFAGGGEIRVNDFDVRGSGNGEARNYAVHFGGSLKGTVNFGCFGADYGDEHERAFLANLSIGELTTGGRVTDDQPITPLYLKVYGTTKGDTEVSTVQTNGENVIITGGMDAGAELDPTPSIAGGTLGQSPGDRKSVV